MSDTSTNNFEELVQNAYTRFGALAKSYYYRFSRTTVTRDGVPAMLFLGNHSSGKSTLINGLVGGDAVQDVGLAPTDDGFTILVYGETEEDICGPAAVARLPEEFAGLKLFGGNFLQHLRIKVRNRPLLKTVTLIDSPGMIDSAEHTVDRAYDFEGVVRLLAELCDMVFFLLDPDKPGTTGETVNVFSKCLGGMEFKLRVLLNKCDAFSSLYDFARTYGTVCWNLARVLQTKDLPKIWTIYSGETRATGDGNFDLTDFNRHREEFLNIVKDAAARRRDNVFSQAQNDFLGLSIRMCIVNHAVRKLNLLAALCLLAGTLFLPAFFLGLLTVLQQTAGWGTVLAYVGASLATGVALFAGWHLARLARLFKRHQLARNVDDIFATEYRQQVAVGPHDNLRQVWEVLKAETAETVRKAPLGTVPFFGEFRRRQLDAAAAKVFSAFNRSVGGASSGVSA